MKRFAVAAMFVCLSTMLAGCALGPVGLEEPRVAVTNLTLLPSRGLEQRLAVHLKVMNPNARDLSLRGISYTISIENFDLLAGATSDLPELKAYEETPVTVEVSTNLLEVARLVEHFSRRGQVDDVGYRFEAKLDFSAWLPDTHVEETGSFSLREFSRSAR